MANAQVRWLDIQELVYRIGWFLPFECNFVLDRYKAIPQDLVACVRINRLWHQTLTPLLWMVFSDYGAKKLGVPQSIIESNSHLFLYAKLHSDFPISDLHLTRLRELDLVVMDPEDITVIVDLLAKNPSLESLQVEFRCLNGERATLDLLDALHQLTKLGQLFLSWRAQVTLDHLVQSLVGCTNLRKLELEGPMGLQSVNAVDLQLNSITDLVLYCEWNENPGLPLFVRHCVNLESLKIPVQLTSIAHHPFVFPSAELSKNLRENCPRLISIRTIDLPSDAYSDLSEEDQLNLLASTRYLVHFDIPVNFFTTRFCTTLLAHAAWLETVHIYCKEATEDSFRKAGQIMSECPKLRSFVFAPEKKHLRPENCLALLEQPWKCLDLEELELCRFNVCDTKEQRLLKSMLELRGQEKEEEEEGEEHGYIIGVEGPTDAASGGSSDGSEFNESNAEERIRRSISRWTKIGLQHPPDPRMYERLSEQGWILNDYKGRTLIDLDKESFILEKIFHEKVFERVLAWRYMRKINLGMLRFVKKGSVV